MRATRSSGSCHFITGKDGMPGRAGEAPSARSARIKPDMPKLSVPVANHAHLSIPMRGSDNCGQVQLQLRRALVGQSDGNCQQRGLNGGDRNKRKNGASDNVQERLGHDRRADKQ